MLDLVFVGAFHMGIAGAGWGTAAANLVRCMVSILYLSRKTDIYRCSGAKLRWEDIQRIFKLGTIDASFTAMMAIQGVIMLLVILFPSFFYHLNGVQKIPPTGLLCLRLYVTHLIFRGFNSIFRLYFAGREDSKFSSTVTIVSYLTLPVFGFLLSMVYAPAFWLTYLLTEIVLFLLNAVRYASCVQKDMQKEVPEEAVIYLTVAPKDAIEASRSIRKYAEDHKYPARLAYRASLCLEEMIHYSVSINGDSRVRNQIRPSVSSTCLRCFMMSELITLPISTAS